MLHNKAGSGWAAGRQQAGSRQAPCVSKLQPTRQGRVESGEGTGRGKKASNPGGDVCESGGPNVQRGWG